MRTHAEILGELGTFRNGRCRIWCNCRRKRTPIAPDLQAIINRWSDLPKAVKTDILMMVQQSSRTNGVSEG